MGMGRRGPQSVRVADTSRTLCGHLADTYIQSMYRDIWTLGIPMLLTGAIAVGLGVALDWSNAVLGWTIIGVVAFVAGLWGLTRPHARSR